jgi:hypothetical protein
MIQICRKDKEKVYKAIRTEKIDAAEMSFPNLIDDIILMLKRRGLTEFLAQALSDKRRDNSHIPFDILLCLAVAAKLKCKTSLTDVPFAVTEEELLAERGWSLWDNEQDVDEGLFSESVMRKLLAKYSSEEWISFYNSYVQELLLQKLDIQPSIHILHCTKVLINLDSSNYENSSVVKIDGASMCGYKLGILRGILDDSGIEEEIVFGTLKTHDMEQCREMLKTTSHFHENDILINDREFLSREVTNYLKTVRKVDAYIPARENMTICQDAVKLAATSGKWQKRPNRKRKGQEIQLVTDLGSLWESDEPEKDVPIHVCVVHDKKTDKYFVFLTTDAGRTAWQMINTYQLRPEIEEDFRQMKDFWKLEDFKSTKYNYITYHIVMTLVGYLYFQVYKNLEEGKAYVGKSLPVVVKNYKGDQAQVRHHLCWAIFQRLSLFWIPTALCRMHFRSTMAS